MSSWRGSACYPPEYLLSFERRTFPCGTAGSLCSSFLPCWPVGLPSQAPFCHYTLRPVTNRPEGTFEEPPLRFWRRPPQSNYPPNAVLVSNKLVPRRPKGRISTTAPKALACLILRLRPILHIDGPGTTLSCSKGSRGLFRPIAGNRHLHRYYNFTGITVETVSGSLHHSCRSELTRQGISLP